MKTRALGLTGIQVSPFCLGTMLFGKAGNPDQADCTKIIQLVSGRYERASLIVTSNKPFGKAHMFRRTCVR